MPSPDHLIERAAALLRNAPVHPPEKAPEQPVVSEASLAAAPAFVPQPPAAAAPIPPSPAPAAVAPVASPIPPAPAAPAAPLPSPLAAPPPPVPARDAISLEQLQAAGMVVVRGSRTRISEEYRIVLGRVLRALRDEPEGQGAPNLVMVTSAKPGEGKSFTALNLGGSVAQHTHEKVLLVDLDAKMRPISHLLGVDDGPGFFDLLANPSLRPDAVVRPTAIPNLQVLPVGRRIVDEGGPSSAPPITAAITRLARHFSKHIVVLDVPPCLSTSDPHTIAPLVGQVVMVVEAERTQRTEVEAALELVRVCPTITLLLNKVRLTSSHTFGAYDYYGTYA